MANNTGAISSGKPRLLQSPARTRALGDDLGRVLISLDGQTHSSAKRKRDKDSGPETTEIAELRANVASMKAENERLAERFADELGLVTDRLAELEARARRPSWWRRLFGPSPDVIAPTGRPRRKAVTRLRALKSGALEAVS